MKESYKNLLFALTMMACAHSGCNAPSPSPSATSESVELEIKQGDAAFVNRNYPAALSSYQDAKEQIERLSAFETRSLERDTSLLQHYYNLSKVLEARIELTEIAIEIRELPPPELSG